MFHFSLIQSPYRVSRTDLAKKRGKLDRGGRLWYRKRMRKAVSIVTLTLLSGLLTSSNALASSSVHVTSSGNASATVNVKNEFNSTKTSANTSTSHTSVRIETNGEVKEYESNSGDDVDMKYSDGNSTVIIKNGGTTTNTSVTPKPTVKEDKEILKQVQDDKGKDDKKDFFGKIKDAIENFLKNLF